MDYLQYVDADSLLHRLDPRTKFVFFLVMAVLTSNQVGSGAAFPVCFFHSDVVYLQDSEVYSGAGGEAEGAARLYFSFVADSGAV